MIYTGSYILNASKNNKVISISGDRGKSVGFDGKYCRELAPKKDMWDEWHSNKNKIDEIENNRFYIREYIKRNLINLNVKEMYYRLNGYTLLCLEKNNEFCHRHIVAAWFEDELGITVPEIGMEEYGIIRFDRPKYIKKIYLEEKEKLYK